MKKHLLSIFLIILLISCKRDPCTNGKFDLGEDGIDCGGSCKPCFVDVLQGNGTYVSFRVNGGEKVIFNQNTVNMNLQVEDGDSVFKSEDYELGKKTIESYYFTLYTNDLQPGTLTVKNNAMAEDVSFNFSVEKDYFTNAYSTMHRNNSISPQYATITEYDRTNKRIKGSFSKLVVYTSSQNDSLTLTDGQFLFLYK